MTPPRFAPPNGFRPAFDIAKRLKNFESIATVRQRRDNLMQSLRMAGKQGRQLSAALGACGRYRRGRNPPCGSPACPACLREVRRWFVDQAVSLLPATATSPFGVVVTVIPAGWQAGRGHLGTLDLNMVKSAIWRSIHALWLGDYAILGGVDVSFNESAITPGLGHYQLHATVAILGYPTDSASVNQLNTVLRQHFTLEPTAPCPVKVVPLRSRSRQLSYLLKSVFSRRVSISDSRGRANTLKFPLKAPHAREIAMWLDTYKTTDRLILHGVRREGFQMLRTA